MQYAPRSLCPQQVVFAVAHHDGIGGVNPGVGERLGDDLGLDGMASVQIASADMGKVTV